MTTPYVGYYYAFYGDGGYSVDQSFNPILPVVTENANFALYDVTYALQVRFDVRKFNAKLGVIKDAENMNVLSTSFSEELEKFPRSAITITADEFVDGMSAAQVISVGRYSLMYREYIQSINEYFFSGGGVDTKAFSYSTANDISGGVFDGNTYMSLITPYLDSSGTLIKPLNGIISVSSINALLDYAVKHNIFNNRTPLPSDISLNLSVNSFTDGTITVGDITTTTSVDIDNNTVTVTIENTSLLFTTVQTYDFTNNVISVVTTDNDDNSTSTFDINFTTIKQFLNFSLNSDYKYYDNILNANKTFFVSNTPLPILNSDETDYTVNSFNLETHSFTMNDIPFTEPVETSIDSSNNVVYSLVDTFSVPNQPITVTLDNSNNMVYIDVFANGLAENDNYFYTYQQKIDFTNRKIYKTTINSDGISDTLYLDNSPNLFKPSPIYDGSYSSVYHTIRDGFMANDLIFIPGGSTIQLELQTGVNVDSSLNIFDLFSSAEIAGQFGINMEDIDKNNTVSNVRILSTPLLIKLENLS